MDGDREVKGVDTGSFGEGAAGDEASVPEGKAVVPEGGVTVTEREVTGVEEVRSSALSERENAVLNMEEEWRKHGRTKAQAIASMGMSTTSYYLLLHRVLANPQARMERPELVGRLLRLREQRANERRIHDSR